LHRLKKIKQYKIVDILGTGGMGVVYLAIDTILERKVAIKLMHRHLCDDEQTYKRFIQEARVAAGLVHPNIVGIYEIGRAECGPYIVMEYIRGKTLLQFLESNTSVESSLAVKFTLQILSALSFAHSRKTWHRDIKPDNILVTKKDKAVKILDFGIAKILTQKGLTAAGDILGTAEYMAPEQMLDEVTDHRCDIYATGVMLYQILTKRLPFEGENPVAILYKKINEDPVPPSYYNRRIGPRLNDIVLKALSKNKEERWDNAKTFSEALEAIESATATPISSQAGKENDLSEFYLNIHPTTAVGANDKLKVAFVGREKELERLTHRFRQSSKGKGYTVILKGEAGVGKSTLANNFEKFAKKNKAWVLYGVCLYQQGLNAYLPFMDAVRRFFRASGVIPPEEVAELRKLILKEVPLLCDLAELSTEDAGSRVINSPANKDSSTEKLFEAWCHLIALFCNSRPLVLIIDDLHMADEASLRLFHYLSHHVSDKSLLLLGISRSEQYDLQKDGKPTMTAEMLSRISREANLEQITIYRFCRESCDTLIDKSLSLSLFTEEFYNRVYNETKGNPLFVLETLKLLRSRQVIFLKEGVWHNAQEGLEIDVPQKVEDIFVQRVSALNDEEREILELASVIGCKFGASQLSRVLKLPKIKLLKILQRIEAGLQIIASTEVGFHFEHPLLRDMLYTDIALALRREYHAMIASDMKAEYKGDYGDKIAEMALHLRNSGQHSEAAPLLYQAAQRSFALGLYRDATLLIQDYLDAAEQSGASKVKSIVQLDLYFKLGKCYEQTGRLDKSLKAYQKLLELSANKREPTAELGALRCLGTIQIKLGDYETALGIYHKCIEIAERKNLISAAGKAYNNLGVLHFHKGELDEAQYYFEKAIQAKKDEESEYGKASTLMNLGIIADMRSDHDSAIDTYRKALRIYVAEGSNEDQARIQMNMGITYGHQGDWHRAIKTFERGLDLIGEGQDDELKGLLYINLGMAHASLEHHVEATKLAKKALKIFKLMGDTRKVADAYHVFGIIYGTGGSLFQAELFLNESLRLYEQEKHLDAIAETCESFANIYKNNHEVQHAIEYYEKASAAYDKLNLQIRVRKVQSIVNDLRINAQDTIHEEHGTDNAIEKKYASRKLT